MAMANVNFYNLPTLPSEEFPDSAEGSFVYARDVSTLYICIDGENGKVYEPIPKITNAQLQDIYNQLNELRSLIKASGKIYRTITYNLPSHIISSGITIVEDGSKLVTNLTPIGQYLISSVVVTMGGVVVDNAYADGVITIESVTDDITITATEEQITYAVTQSGSGASITWTDPATKPNTVVAGDSITFNVTRQNNNTAAYCRVTHNGHIVNATNGTAMDGSIQIAKNVTLTVTITNISGPIIITYSNNIVT